MSSEPDVEALLKQVHLGDPAALSALAEAHLPWIRAHVQRRMGAGMRALVEREDIVQQVFLDFLKSGPRFVLRDAAHFRALMLRIVENTLRQQHRDAHRKKRDAARVQPLPSGSVLDLGSPVTRPSAAASRDEHRAWVQLALELIPDEQRTMIQMREWEGLPFAEIAEHFGIREDAARMRYQRALRELAMMLLEIKTKGAAALQEP